jgi:hypothetical protein
MMEAIMRADGVDAGEALEVLTGARALVELEARWASAVLDAWQDDRTALLPGANATVGP